MEAGSFVLANLPIKTLRFAATGLHVRVTALPADTTIQARLLHKPSVALYAGQGVDRPTPSPTADLWFGLEALEFDFTLLEAEQITSARLPASSAAVMFRFSSAWKTAINRSA